MTPAARAMCSREWLINILRILAAAYYVDLCSSWSMDVLLTFCQKSSVQTSSWFNSPHSFLACLTLTLIMH